LCSAVRSPCISSLHDQRPTEVYTLSLHDALPIWLEPRARSIRNRSSPEGTRHRMNDRLGSLTCRFPSLLPLALSSRHRRGSQPRSEEHTSELQSRENLVCRLLLENKKNKMR